MKEKSVKEGGIGFLFIQVLIFKTLIGATWWWIEEYCSSWFCWRLYGMIYDTRKNPSIVLIIVHLFDRMIVVRILTQWF